MTGLEYVYRPATWFRARTGRCWQRSLAAAANYSIAHRSYITYLEIYARQRGTAHRPQWPAGSANVSRTPASHRGVPTALCERAGASAWEDIHLRGGPQRHRARHTAVGPGIGAPGRSCCGLHCDNMHHDLSARRRRLIRPRRPRMLSRPRAACGCTLHAASLHWLQAVLSRPHLIHNSLVIISSLVTASQVCHMYHCSMRDDGSLDSCYSYGRAIAATYAPGRGSPLPHLRRDGARPCHICAGTRVQPLRFH
jgi:hypothetical protein